MTLTVSSLSAGGVPSLTSELLSVRGRVPTVASELLILRDLWTGDDTLE